MTLSEIRIYPIKGLAGMEPARSFVELRGLAFDRRWMLVDEDSMFITQRTVPKMAALRATVTETCLEIAAGDGSLGLPLVAEGRERMVTVWRSTVLAQEVSHEANEWFSDQLGVSCALVQMPRKTVRATNPEFSNQDDHVSFADGYPLLLATKESLEDLNKRLASPVPMSRFRPNLVVEGAPKAWAEDEWRTIRIGNITFRNAKPCGRCQVTTVDQKTGIPTGDEPLRTLATFRRFGNSVNFGINLIPDCEGWIEIGNSMAALSG